MVTCPETMEVVDTAGSNADADESPKECDSEMVSPEMEVKIAELAYYKAEKRGFEPGHELEDWLEAKRELGC